jgi:dienelactone hydrolase
VTSVPASRHLGPFADWIDKARRRRPLWGERPAGPATQALVRSALDADDEPSPHEVRVERAWSADGVDGEEVSWRCAFGPRARAWVLRPSERAGLLPGIVALHGHDGAKFYGKEKIADGPDGALPGVRPLRERLYGGAAFANALARRGFVVLAHDVFTLGSRRFPLESMPQPVRRPAEDRRAVRATAGEATTEAEHYDEAARHHEHVVEKYCRLLGTTLAAVVNREDRCALAYLRSRPDVRALRVGCVGLSGGGCRAAMLQATSDSIGAAVVVGMMSSYAHLLDRHVQPHTWMFFPAGLPTSCDWPDLAACRAPSPLLVQYCRDDQLFPLSGMEAAHERISGLYRSTGQPEAYRGEFHAGPHRFDRAMQDAAFTWLERQLGSRSGS